MTGNEGASDRGINQAPRWPNSRGWIAIGVFAIAVMCLLMMRDAEMRQDEFFQNVSLIIITNGLILIVNWAFGSSEASEQQAKDAVGGKTKPVEIVNDKQHPIHVVDDEPDDELPEYAR